MQKYIVTGVKHYNSHLLHPIQGKFQVKLYIIKINKYSIYSIKILLKKSGP